MPDIATAIAAEVGAEPAQVAAAVKLLDNGATVPFIARYRKETTGGLDDRQLRRLEERLAYLRELDRRRERILQAIDEQGALDDTLRERIEAADSKARLEDLYLPYKPRRRTRAERARQAGLESLATLLLGDPTIDPVATAGDFVAPGRGISDPADALEGARDILVEQFSEEPDLISRLRELLWRRGLVRSRVVPGQAKAGQRYADYFDFSEPVAAIPSHRLLAILRARSEGFVQLELELPEASEAAVHPCVEQICLHYRLADQQRNADRWLLATAEAAWARKIRPHLVLSVLGQARQSAEEQAVVVFADNLRDLLLAPPAGPRVTMGLDPGLRHGVKVAVVDATGKVLTTTTVYPHAPRERWDQSRERLAALIARHAVELVAIGDGKASRRTLELVREIQHRRTGFDAVVVSESGASVYSASALAAAELPQLDVSLRGAVSIARRLQDPLAELVKIDPRAIGVGQYQHDVNQVELARALDAVVEDCVNAVGVEVNTASSALLARVAGLGPALADNIVAYRDVAGPFPSRQSMLGVPRLGPRAFEQAAGFLRIAAGDNPLDASAVHPETYGIVDRIVAKLGQPLEKIMGNRTLLATLDPDDFTSGPFGRPTVVDILAELARPGRDPRVAFQIPRFKAGARKAEDLQVGEVIEGVVSNVTNFGAFVNVGVGDDGLIHISELADRFVSDPRTIVKAGDIVRVKVISVDLERRRIGLSRRSGQGSSSGPRPRRTKRGPGRKGVGESAAEPRGALGTALAEALKKSRKN